MGVRVVGHTDSAGLRMPWSTGVAGAALLLTSWLITRVILLAQTFGGDIPTDVSAYARWAGDVSAGVAPALDTAYVYPPGALVVFLAVDALSADSYYRAFTLVAFLIDFSILAMLWWRVRSVAIGQRSAPWAWIVMGFAAGPLMYQRYDIFAALFGVLALLAVSRPVWNGIWSGVGALVKLWPEIALLGLARRNLWRGVAVNLGVVAAGWILLHLVWGDSFGFLANVANKGLSVEATAAFPFLVARSLGTSHGVTGQFGSWEVTGPGVELAATATTVLGVALLIGLFLWRLAGRLESVSPGDVVLFGVLIFVATHKINSLQYGVWIAAMTATALVFASSRAHGPAVILTLMLLVADQVIWDNFVPFISGNPLMIGYQGLRLILLIIALIWIGWTILATSKKPRLAAA